jgi:hypothetical protein
MLLQMSVPPIRVPNRTTMLQTFETNYPARAIPIG